VIRKARLEEADAVRSVVVAAYQHYIRVIGRPPAPMTDDYAARIAADQVWVLEDDSGLAGVLVLEDGPDCFLLDNIAIRPDRQNLGYGRQLLDLAEAEAVRCGWKTVTLYTNALMSDNIAIYSGRGYQEASRKVERGFSRVYMAKPVG
jgi:N-acetylglutamate synthase-like GNAT family acetyltransferase